MPNAKQIRLVQDNSPHAGGVRRAPLNTDKPASLYATFPAEEARRRVKRLMWPSTPKHGRRNMAESEIAVLIRQSLDRRIADRKTLAKETVARQKRRNKHHPTAHWQFTTADARIKLKHLYPTF